MIWKNIVKRTFPGEDGTLPKKPFSEQLRKLENIYFENIEVLCFLGLLQISGPFLLGQNVKLKWCNIVVNLMVSS